MPLSVVDLYKDILPKTNCGDCGHPTCLAFASMVVARKLPLENCPHIEPEKLEKAKTEIDAQHKAEIWTKKDMAKDALIWAMERAASMNMADLKHRIGATAVSHENTFALKLSYFKWQILIIPSKDNKPENIMWTGEDIPENELTIWEKTFLFNHMAQGGSKEPKGDWHGFEEFPNTVSKIKSMKSHVEEPLIKRFTGKLNELKEEALNLGGLEVAKKEHSADIAFFFRVLPKVPVMLLFWDADPNEDFPAKVKLVFDKTAPEHLDIESIMFLSERLANLLIGEKS